MDLRSRDPHFDAYIEQRLAFDRRLLDLLHVLAVGANQIENDAAAVKLVLVEASSIMGTAPDCPALVPKLGLAVLAMGSAVELYLD